LLLPIALLEYCPNFSKFILECLYLIGWDIHRLLCCLGAILPSTSNTCDGCVIPVFFILFPCFAYRDELNYAIDR
jgi:hypothetical protein